MPALALDLSRRWSIFCGLKLLPNIGNLGIPKEILKFNGNSSKIFEIWKSLGIAKFPKFQQISIKFPNVLRDFQLSNILKYFLSKEAWLRANTLNLADGAPVNRILKEIDGILKEINGILKELSGILKESMKALRKSWNS